MSRTQEINYPPEEIFKEIGVERPNIEHVILWMLKNNDIVIRVYYTPDKNNDTNNDKYKITIEKDSTYYLNFRFFNQFSKY